MVVSACVCVRACMRVLRCDSLGQGLVDLVVGKPEVEQVAHVHPSHSGRQCKALSAAPRP